MRRATTIVSPWDQRLAGVLVRPLVGTGVTPNQITTVSLIVGLLGAILFALGGTAVHVGGALFMLSFWLDHADGALARMAGKTSVFGHYYDLAAGAAVLIATFIGIGLGLDGAALRGWAVPLGVITACAIAIIFVLRGELERQYGKPSTRQPSWLGFEVEDVLYLVGPIAWAGALAPFLLLAGIGTPLFALWVLWQCRALVRGGHRAW